MIYHFLNGHNGGRSVKYVLALLRGAGLEATPVWSQYVGHSAVEVTGGARVQARAERVVFSNGLPAYARGKWLRR